MSIARSSDIPRTVYLLVAIHVALVAGCAVRYGFAWTEVGLLPAGVLDWQYGSFDVFRVNPPLVRMWAALPAMAVAPEIEYYGASPDPRRRAEWTVARAMLDADPAAAHRALAFARLFCLPFTIAGMWVAARWAGELFGRPAAIGAAIIWAFFPSMIGYGCLISGDAQAASMGLITVYLFRSWLLRPGWAEAYLLGLTLGLAILTKVSWLILLGLLPLLWVTIRMPQWIGAARRRLGSKPVDDRDVSDAVAPRPLKEATLMLVALTIAVLSINVLYGFGGSFRRLDSFDFISKALAGSERWEPYGWSGNRFQGTLLGGVRVPLPESLVIGVDLQKWDFDRERWSYFRGQWRDQGWWYYYLYGLGIKLPIGFLMLVGLSVWRMLRRRNWRADWADELLLWVPLLAVVTLASLETGLNRHLRYVLPALPFAIVIASRTCRAYSARSRWLGGFVSVALAWMIASSLWIYPHSLSYFNESVGGPMRAHRHVNASNLDWGQDLPYLRRWQQANPDKRPLLVQNYLHITPPETVGIEVDGIAPSMLPADRRDPSPPVQFSPGWYAVDRETILRRAGDYTYLRGIEPADWAGYGFQIFEITPELADELERGRDGRLEEN